MLEEGEPEEEYGPKGKADAPAPLDPEPAVAPLGPRWLPLVEACWVDPAAPDPEVMCWARNEASNGMSTPVRSLEGVLEGESPAEPGVVEDGTNVWNFFSRLGGSFREPRTETGGLKRVGGR